MSSETSNPVIEYEDCANNEQEITVPFQIQTYIAEPEDSSSIGTSPSTLTQSQTTTSLPAISPPIVPKECPNISNLRLTSSITRAPETASAGTPPSMSVPSITQFSGSSTSGPAAQPPSSDPVRSGTTTQVHSDSIDLTPIKASSHTDVSQPQPSTSSQGTDLIISIDFGTTFTGVACFATSSIKSKDPKIIAQSVSVIRKWPAVGGQAVEKIPTIVAYDGGKPTAWGAKVKPSHKTTVEHFKLGLYEESCRFYEAILHPSTASGLGGFGTDHNWKHPCLQEKTAVDFTADYLSEIRRFVADEVLPIEYGTVFLRRQQISYVITVPAIWSDKAKDRTSQAASRAGIPANRLVFISEPEAAALYCATMHTEVDLHAGDRFLICDAGGGTVDLISYQVACLAPFMVSECTVGIGAACGSIFLDKGFIRLLKNKLGPKAGEILTPECIKTCISEFNSTIKLDFDPLEDSSETEYGFYVRNAPDIPDIGLEHGLLRLDDIQSVFDPVFQKILELVQQQIDAVKEKDNSTIKVIFLVGGLGSNRYLGKFLQQELKPGPDVKQPMAGYSAIMRGAVLYKMELNMVKDRVMRRYYGVDIAVPFGKGDPEKFKFRAKDGTFKCSNVLDWFVSKGQKVAARQTIQRSFRKDFWTFEYERNVPLDHVISLLSSEESKAPLYKNDKVPTVCSIKVDLRDLPKEAFRKQITEGGTFYEVEFDLAIVFGPVLEFKMLYQGAVKGRAIAKYD